MSTMVGPAQKPHRPSWGQAMHLPNLATILLEPCWSGIVKKRKEKVSFSIRKWPTSWRHRIEAKNTWKTYFFWLNSPFKGCNQLHMLLFASVDGSAKEWQKELILIELVTFLLEKQRHEEPQKMTIKLTFGLKNSPQSLSNMKKLSSTCDNKNKRKKKEIC